MRTNDHETTDISAEDRESTPHASGPDGAAGGSGSSSEWVGHTGPGQVGANGLRDTSLVETPADAPSEQSEGGEEPSPDGLEPKAGHPRLDPRHDDKPYRTEPQR